MNEVVECVDLQDLYMPVDLLEIEYVDSEVEEEDGNNEAG